MVRQIPSLLSSFTGFFKAELSCISLVDILCDDNITPRMLKESAEVIAAPLTSVFNSSILQCRYASPWKKGQITPLLKSSEDDTNEKFFRPVTVLPALSNIFERFQLRLSC